ncbi:hypothetical protein AV530_017314 [Patagioenas fasciata monilis]|uniref:Uncharacterized protein n=1 Tax=Patagioenas fasciata monilis TaxID=372326 RepID=A0A1V4JG20_PATFA|nr:hypothetical protein AV530_017314 [Patagioenas fasciata monilis]
MSAPFKCLGPSQMALDTFISKAESNTPLQQIIFLWDLDKCFKLNTASGYSEYGRDRVCPVATVRWRGVWIEGVNLSLGKGRGKVKRMYSHSFRSLSPP